MFGSDCFPIWMNPTGDNSIRRSHLETWHFYEVTFASNLSSSALAFCNFFKKSPGYIGFLFARLFLCPASSKKKRTCDHKKSLVSKALFSRLGCLEGKFVGALWHVIIGVVRENWIFRFWSCRSFWFTGAFLGSIFYQACLRFRCFNQLIYVSGVSVAETVWSFQFRYFESDIIFTVEYMRELCNFWQFETEFYDW